MSNRRVIMYLLLGIALLVGAHLFLSFKGVGGALVQKTALLDAAVQRADRIEVVRADGARTMLVRDEGWRVAAPYSALAEGRDILRLLDAMYISRVQAVYGEQDLVKFDRTREDYGLDPPAVRLTFSSAGAERSVSIGILTPTADGVFASVEGDPSIYVVETNVLVAADKPANGFRLRSLCPGGVESVDAFDLKRGKGVFMRFVRVGGVWTKAAAKEGDPSEPASAAKIKELLSGLGAASAVEFLWPVGASNEPAIATAPLLAGYGLDPDSAITVTLHSSGRADQQVVLGKEAKDGLVYALVQDAGAVVTVDGALKDLAGGADFIDARLFPFERASVTRVSIADGGVSYLVARADDGSWHLDAPVSVEADAPSVNALLSRLLELTYSDRDPNGVGVSLSADAPAETVSRSAVVAGAPLEDLRSREILRIDPADVKRIAVTWRGAAKPTSVVFDRDLRSWIVESAERPGTVAQASVEGMLGALTPLRADKIVKLKVSATDLRRYGLETPRFTFAVDSAKEGALRRNVLVGERAQGGFFATLGSADAVFVLSDEKVRLLSAPLVTE